LRLSADSAKGFRLRPKKAAATVTVAAGLSGATFTIATTAFTSTQTVTITAALRTVQPSANLAVNPASGDISLQGKSFDINGTVTLAGTALSFEIGVIAQSSSADFVELVSGRQPETAAASRTDLHFSRNVPPRRVPALRVTLGMS